MSAPDFDPVDEGIAVLIDRRALIASKRPEDQAPAAPFRAALAALFAAERALLVAETAAIPEPTTPEWPPRRAGNPAHAGHIEGSTHAEG